MGVSMRTNLGALFVILLLGAVAAYFPATIFFGMFR
jgi:hypothetical protein